MSDSYTKLFSSITRSTIWGESAPTRVVWVTMLAGCNRHGEYFASVPGLARDANVTLAECTAALERFLAPDPYSRTPDHEGRRIQPIDGGWRILNHAKFDRMSSQIETEDRRTEYKRQWDRDNRPSGHARSQSDSSPTKSDESPSQSDPPPTPTPTVAPEDQKHSVPCNTRANMSRARDPNTQLRALALDAARVLNTKGVSTSTSNPKLLAALADGVTVQHLVDIAELHPGKSAGYIIATAHGQQADGARPLHIRSAAPAPRSRTLQAMQAIDEVVQRVTADTEAKPVRRLSDSDRTKNIGEHMPAILDQLGIVQK